ncbi:PTS galactitol transporter subunit IIB [Tetragenococcus halophilus]|uniref:PTS galactitol transporter subunit IIB n=1 Tax=Tetragenococcus halophilus TaxID=51669 RepID=UPI001F1FF98C|nr:PTS galactitol transporter subunit IIB [Tetragenococcus halophilus]MCF1684741.1 PTS galactitol transporter subunit IIB [Tetragenococcus halophilus]
MVKRLEILVVCGNGAVTSTVVLNKIKDGLQKEGIQTKITQKRVAEGAQALESNKFDLAVSTAGQNFAKDSETPVLNGVPFLTGVGQDSVISQIIELANK